MTYRIRTRGFSLLEVLIAVLIFSFGLLGVAGLMVLSVRTNHSAYLRTQASFLAQSMAERMRTNLGWIVDYNGTYDASTVGTNPCSGSICTPTDLVQRDRNLWSQQLVDFLPSPTATILCNVTGAPFSAAHRGAQPFDGQCTMTISWTEADLDRNSGAPATQTFAWVFQP
ncbi:type IV pilus modification protein PilV [Dokdonella sp.]|uniref:type IV pilus modification protein PilV n=1 Tax=Dokdonella sp. TaxID=2291710 RepID=UPI0025B804B6|nr:type IV pilus modification protein PilV [Dokdonella sp.]